MINIVFAYESVKGRIIDLISEHLTDLLIIKGLQQTLVSKRSRKNKLFNVFSEFLAVSSE